MPHLFSSGVQWSYLWHVQAQSHLWKQFLLLGPIRLSCHEHLHVPTLWCISSISHQPGKDVASSHAWLRSFTIPEGGLRVAHMGAKFIMIGGQFPAKGFLSSMAQMLSLLYWSRAPCSFECSVRAHQFVLPALHAGREGDVWHLWVTKACHSLSLPLVTSICWLCKAALHALPPSPLFHSTCP